MITIGRIVHYVLGEDDAQKINRRRTSGPSIAERITSGSWPIGAQAHIGNTVAAGMEFPAMCVRNSRAEGDFQVFLDGNDVFWASSAQEDQNTDKTKPPTPGTWHWPARE